jgi:hypothetical protein
MRVRSNMATLAMLVLSALTVLILLGATARVSLGDASHVDVAPMVLESVADELAGDECTAPAEAAEIEDLGAAYECPHGIPYCQRASQCTDFCGAGFEGCFQGCCACTG